MTKHIFIFAVLGFYLAGCGASKTGSATDTSDTPAPTDGTVVTQPGSSPTASTTSPLNLQIYTQYDTTKALEYQTFAEQNSVTCIATSATPEATCTLNIQEGRLFFSSLNFQFAWNNSVCSNFIFKPYYYHASDSATYLPPWSSDTSLNCSTAGGNTPPNNCWGGAAPYMVPGFPKKDNVIYLHDESVASGPQTGALNLVSAFSLNYGSNRLTVNDMPLANQSNSYNYGGLHPQPVFMAGPNGSADSYMANTFKSYELLCVDDYADPLPYKIHLFINDVDSKVGNPVEDDYYTWKEVH